MEGWEELDLGRVLDLEVGHRDQVVVASQCLVAEVRVACLGSGTVVACWVDQEEVGCSEDTLTSCGVVHEEEGAALLEAVRPEEVAFLEEVGPQEVVLPEEVVLPATAALPEEAVLREEAVPLEGEDAGRPEKGDAVRRGEEVQEVRQDVKVAEVQRVRVVETQGDPWGHVVGVRVAVKVAVLAASHLETEQADPAVQSRNRFFKAE